MQTGVARLETENNFDNSNGQMFPHRQMVQGNQNQAQDGQMNSRLGLVDQQQSLGFVDQADPNQPRLVIKNKKNSRLIEALLQQ